MSELGTGNIGQPQIGEIQRVMMKLTDTFKISVPESWKDDPHYWYLVSRHYSRERKTHPRYASLFKGKIDRKENLEELRKIALGKAVDEAADFASIEKEAATDGLTGAFNKRALDNFLLNLLGHERPFETSAIVMFDIDHFKQFNDIYGHPVGDDVLRQLVKLIKEQIRGIDFLARYGGEEFMLIVPGIDTKDEKWKENILKRVNELRKKIAQELKTNVKDSKGEFLKENITASFGVMFMDDLTTVTNAEELKKVYNQVDERLYQAKRSGRNCVIGQEGKFISNSPK